MKFKQVLLIIAISFASAFTGIFVYHKYFRQAQLIIVNEKENQPVRYSKYFTTGNNAIEAADFTKAAGSAVPAVVHIKTKTAARKLKNHNDDSEDDFFNRMFGKGINPYIVPEQRASGSGVIVSDDGYIVTNNHVITDDNGAIAGDIDVTLSNSKSYKAKVIGRSETTDIAVLKIDENNLPYMVFGNSDLLQTGQWVLAIGYPLNLEATVTAGIISATGRNVPMSSRQAKNDAANERFFIQTDAAVNLGNSGGALINTDGELVGVTAAIMSPTGTYAGYSFAIPVNNVKAAVKEIIQSGGFNRRS